MWDGGKCEKKYIIWYTVNSVYAVLKVDMEHIYNYIQYIIYVIYVIKWFMKLHIYYMIELDTIRYDYIKL